MLQPAGSDSMGGSRAFLPSAAAAAAAQDSRQQRQQPQAAATLPPIVLPPANASGTDLLLAALQHQQQQDAMLPPQLMQHHLQVGGSGPSGPSAHSTEDSAEDDGSAGGQAGGRWHAAHSQARKPAAPAAGRHSSEDKLTANKEKNRRAQQRFRWAGTDGWVLGSLLGGLGGLETAVRWGMPHLSVKHVLPTRAPHPAVPPLGLQAAADGEAGLAGTKFAAPMLNPLHLHPACVSCRLRQKEKLAWLESELQRLRALLTAHGIDASPNASLPAGLPPAEGAAASPSGAAAASTATAVMGLLLVPQAAALQRAASAGPSTEQVRTGQVCSASHVCTCRPRHAPAHTQGTACCEAANTDECCVLPPMLPFNSDVRGGGTDSGCMHPCHPQRRRHRLPHGAACVHIAQEQLGPWQSHASTGCGCGAAGCIAALRCCRYQHCQPTRKPPSDTPTVLLPSAPRPRPACHPAPPAGVAASRCRHQALPVQLTKEEARQRAHS